MALSKQSVTINFRQGLDLKSDPYQIPLGRFFSLVNSVFTKAGLLAKRNGFPQLPSITNVTANYLTTYNGNLTAIGQSLAAYSQGSKSWINKGSFKPLSLSVQPLVRSAFNQTQADAVTAPNGLICTVYTEVNSGTSSYKYVIEDSKTGQNIVSPTLIPVSSGVVTGAPRVFLFGNYFIIAFTNVISAVSHLQYVAISSLAPTVVTANRDIAANYTAKTTLSWDAVTVGTSIFFAYNTTAGGQQVAVTSMNQAFIVATPISFAGSIATIMSMCADVTNTSSPVIYASFYDLVGSTGYVVAVDQNLNTVMTATQIIASGTVKNMTCTAQGNISNMSIVTVAFEVANNYAFDSTIASNFLNSITVQKPLTVTTGTAGSPVTFVRSLGLASKAFLLSGTMYMLSEL